MAKLNMYDQQTAFQAPRGDAQAFGAAPAQALGQMGEVAMDLGLQMKRREDVIDRVQRLTDFDALAQNGLTAVNDTEDIAKKATVDGYVSSLRQKASEILAQHTGTAASRAELQAQLTNQVGQYAKSATAAQVKAQQQFIGRRVEQSANALAASGAFAPQMLPQLFEQFDAELGTYADAMSPEQAAAYKEAGRSQIAMGAIDKLQQEGQWQSAKAMLQNPEVTKYLAPAAARKFAIDVAVDERKSELETVRQNKNVANIASLLRRNLTPEEVIRAKALPPKKDMMASDKIAELELVKGRPASQAEINEIFNVESGNPGGAFGNSMEGRAWSFVTENAPAYAAGLMTPEQRRQYDASLAIVGKPTTRINPLTSQMETISPELPGWVKQAVQQGQSYSAPSGGTGGASPGQRIRLTDATGRAVGEATVGPDGSWTIQNGNPSATWSAERDIPQASAPAAGGGASTPSNQQGIPSTPQGMGGTGRTIWERRASIAGPIAGAASAVNSVPGIGPAIAGAAVGEEQIRQIESDRTFVENASRDLIRVLQNNPQFAEGERKAIEKELSIGPEFFKSGPAYEAKLMGVAQSLTKRKLDAQRSLGATISGDERKRAMDSIAAIDNFMVNMGMPQMPTTVEEWNALPPGTVVMDRKGQTWTK